MPKRRQTKPGYGMILDQWSPPDDAGNPIGCLATSFTFDPVFFEEHCLGRFLRLETEPAEDGAAYLVEREEKLAQVTCAAALVDQNHCRGSRSLRWDLLSARVPRGILHAKISLLYWQNLVRLIVASANLTEDGYRRNLEVYGVLDYCDGGETPLECLKEIVGFLRQAGTFADPAAAAPCPAISRWNALLDQVLKVTRSWGMAGQPRGRSAVRIGTVLAGPGRQSTFESLRQAWTGHGPPSWAYVVSPFFDPPSAPSAPARELWRLLRQRGKAHAAYCVTAEDVPGKKGKTVLLHAPESLLMAQPQNQLQASTGFCRLTTDPSRPLHAKCLWMENDSWTTYLIGSSNFTSAGSGLAGSPNLEANLLYSFRSYRKAYWAAEQAFPDYEEIGENVRLCWQPPEEVGDEAEGDVVVLPDIFSQATYSAPAGGQGSVELHLEGTPKAGWSLLTEDGGAVLYTEAAWQAAGSPAVFVIPWTTTPPPSGLLVHWEGSGGSAWWPVNVESAASLPPPEELQNLPLEVLIDVLTSVRPLHLALRGWLKHREKGGKADSGIDLDPHKRVDTSTFLLQRTRRISWALTALRHRLERPVSTQAGLKWRLRGPVGVMAVATAIEKEARLAEERSFLLAELALELSQVRPQAAAGCLKPAIVMTEIRKIVEELRTLIAPSLMESVPDLSAYVLRAFARAQA